MSKFANYLVRHVNMSGIKADDIGFVERAIALAAASGQVAMIVSQLRWNREQ